MEATPNKSRSRTMRISITVLAVTAVAAIGLWNRANPELQSTPPAMPPVASASGSVFEKLPVSGDPPAGSQAAPPPPEVLPATVPGESRTATVNRLMASGRPEDAFLAFQIINACLHARTYEVAQAQRTADPTLLAMLPKAGEACAGLEPGQLAARVRLLVQAGQAGVPGTFHEASGLLYSELKNDPELRAALPQIQEAAIQRGEAGAIGMRIDEILASCRPTCSSEQLAEAIKLQTAFGLITRAEKRDLGLPDTLTPKLVERAGPVLAAHATEQGKALAFATKGVK